MAFRKAWRIHSYGGPSVLKLDDVPVPEPGPSQVLVAVSKAGMNPFDWKIREGYLKDNMPLPLPAILGVDFSGTVERVGSEVSRFKPGDRVMALSRKLGAFADAIVVDESILARVPEGLDDATAASLPIPALTAWQALRAAGELSPGMKILINGASGITGAFAVQFAKAAGAYVIGTASSKNRAYAESLGVDQFIDYQTQNFEEFVHDTDLVLDFVLLGGDRRTTDRAWQVLKPNGAQVSVADPSILKKIPVGYRGFYLMVGPDAKTLEYIAEQVVNGKIKSKIARVYPRGKLVEAMEANKAGGTTGRLLTDFKDHS